MPRRRDIQEKYRGTVLVMVVGLLVMLFVMGTSFLFVSRFERRMTEEMMAHSGGTGGGSGGGAGEGDSVVVLRNLLEEIRDQLRKDIVGADGNPYNADLDGDTGSVREDFWDTPGWFDVNSNAFPFVMDQQEISNRQVPRTRANPVTVSPVLQTDEVGDGLLAGNEPYADPNNMAYSRPLWTWFAVSSFADNNPRLSHQVVQCPDNNPSYPGSAYNWMLPWGPPTGLPNFHLNLGAATFRYDLYHERPQSWEAAGLLPDADGDGYPDFLFATRERESDNNETGATAVPPAELWPDEEDPYSWASKLDIDQKVALRVISHGGMVLLGRDVPRTLLLAATAEPGTGSLQHLIWPDNSEELEPRIEEANLRRRNCLPTPYDENDIGGPTDKRTEFERDNRQWLETRDGEGEPRWYPLEYDEQEANGSNTLPDVGDQTQFEDRWMSATDPRYDRRHLVTTISYDDLYRPNRGEAGIGWIDASNRPVQLGDSSFGGQFVPGVLRRIGTGLGEVPYLPDEGLIAPDVNGNRPAGRTQLSLADLDEIETVYTKGQQIRLLYAFYRAMLEDTAIDGPRERNEQAAMLAVNTWDFFDSNSVPTVASMMGDDLDVMDLNADGITYGANGEREVLGIEGLPFLTQAYVGGKYRDEPEDQIGEFNVQAYAIELFNPWPVPIRLTPLNFKIGLLPIPQSITIPAAQTPGLLNPGSSPSNLAVISSVPIAGVPYVVGKDIRDMTGLTFGSTVSISYTVRGTTYVIDKIDPSDGDDQHFDADFEWPKPDDDPQEAGNYRAVSLVRGTTNIYNNNAWLYALGRERDVESTVSGSLPLLGLGQGDVGPQRSRPLPIFTSDSGEPGTAFPCTGSLLLVSRYAHLAPVGGVGVLPQVCFAEQSVADIDLADGTTIVEPDKRIDNGHMPVFDQEQYAGVEDDENDAQIKVPWGQLVFSYFTAIPLQRMNLDGAVDDYDGDERYNRPSTSWQDYRQAYGNLLQRYTLFSLDPNAGLPVPIVERVPARDGYAYGPRVRGRININTAPWAILDGVPLIQYFNTSNVGPIAVIDRAINDILSLGPGARPIDADLTISSELARSIVAYREARRVWEGSADYRDRATAGGLLGRDSLQGVGAMRRGPGFVTVGELANLVHGQAPPNYAPGDSAYRIDAFNGNVGGSFNDFSHAIAILASLPDWLTVKSNTYTAYATVVDTADEVEATRGQWTLDRTRCLYQSDRTSAGLPEIIGPEVIVAYADAAADPD